MNLLSEDVGFVTSRLPASVLRAMQCVETPCILAGGFVRDVISKSEPSDIDLFVSSKERAIDLANCLCASGGLIDKGPPVETENAISALVLGAFGEPVIVQVIRRWTFASAEDVVKHFDFSICAAAIWWDARKQQFASECHHRFYADLAAKRLTYTIPPVKDAEPGGSLLRAMKFAGRGYTMPLDSLGEIVARLAGQAVPKYGPAGTPVDVQAVVAQLRLVDPIARLL